MIPTISARDWPVETVLRGALDRIRFGWYQGGFFADLDGRDANADAASAYCLLGAIHAETAARGLGPRVASRAKRHVAFALGDSSPETGATAGLLSHVNRDALAAVDHIRAIGVFNDTRGRAKDEVIAVLQRALDALEVGVEN